MKYKAKIDWWISLLLYGTNVLMIGLAFVTPPSVLLFYLLVCTPYVLLVFWLLWGSYYQLRDDEIYSKMGPFFSHIKYDLIKSVKLRKSILSSMAMTINRVEIQVHNKSYIRGTTFLGPKNREEFAAELKQRCKNLESKTSKEY